MRIAAREAALLTPPGPCLISAAMSKIDLANLDRRVAERLIRAGQLSQEEWDKYLATLEDVSDKADTFSAELQTGVLEKRKDGE